MNKPPARVSQKKKDLVKKLIKKLQESASIGVINMHGMPAGALSAVKVKLRGKAEIIMTRKTLFKLAFDKVKRDGIEKLEESIDEMPALIFSNENPFAIYKIIKQSKMPAPAKAGSIAPREIVIPAGPTPFGPGPIISEFAQLGIKAGVEEGKVAIKVEKVIEEGTEISEKMAGMLTKLDIKPFEVGMNVVCIFEGGTVFAGSVLDIDEVKFTSDLTTAASEAFNLAVEAVIFNTDTVEPLLQKAWREGKEIALEGSFLADEVVEELLSRAEQGAMSVKLEAKL